MVAALRPTGKWWVVRSYPLVEVVFFVKGAVPPLSSS